MSDFWCQTSVIRHLISDDVCYQTPDVMFLMFVIRRPIFDFRQLLSHVWFLMSDNCYQMSDFWCQTSVIRHLISDSWWSLLSDIWCHVPEIRDLVSNAWCLISNVWFLMSDICYKTSDFWWYLLSDIWCHVSEIRHLVSDIWSLLSDICYRTSHVMFLKSDTWYQMSV